MSSLGFALPVVAAIACHSLGWSQTMAWQQSTPSAAVFATSPDGHGGLFAAGTVGPPSATSGWVGRYSIAGAPLWTQTIGSSAEDSARAVSPCALGGGFTAGSTYGNLAATNAGQTDAWLARYDDDGSVVWVHQWGGQSSDAALAVVDDGSGGAFSSGYSSTGSQEYAWLRRHDSNGALLWSRQVDSAGSDFALSALVVDGSGGAYVGGSTTGNIAGTNQGYFDAWWARFDALGNQLWIRQFGTTSNDTTRVLLATGTGSVVVGGESGTGGWIAEYTSSGSQQWLKSATFGQIIGASPDSSGKILVATVNGKIARYSRDGVLEWVQPLDLSPNVSVYGAKTDGHEGVSVCGAQPGGGSQSGWLGRAGCFCYVDADLDGYGTGALVEATCPCLPGFSSASTDCDDTNPAAYPGALEVCDGVDNNCDGVIDEGLVYAYCTAGTTVHGCVPSITGLGVPSSVATGSFDIVIRSVPGMRSGTIFYGFYQANLPWAPFSPSYQCIAFPIQRTGDRQSGGTAGQCNGELRLDFNAWRAANPGSLGSPFVAGQVFYAQGWFRDPGAPKQTNLSDGLRFVLCN